ncbi:MAG: DNA-binding protein WhiA [Eubacterium sp.]|nr:DNA-binding protein WhiA [Eubacterium sp.]
MSFSKRVKKELGQQISKARHCQIAELSALFEICGKVDVAAISSGDGDGSKKKYINFRTENLTVGEKYSILFSKVFHCDIPVSQSENLYEVSIDDMELAESFVAALKLKEARVMAHELIVQRECCKKAYVRGLFLSCGSVTDPDKGYHLEFSLTSREKAESLIQLIGFWGIRFKMIERKKNYIVYLKDGECIVNILGIMGAHVALMEYENVRILKDVRNSVNRKVNCETANIKKTVSAATRQIEDIQYIRDTTGFGHLTDSLRDMAMLRLEYPDLPLKELGDMLSPPIGKSGVNHRLRKLSEIAEGIRAKERTQ